MAAGALATGACRLAATWACASPWTSGAAAGAAAAGFWRLSASAKVDSRVALRCFFLGRPADFYAAKKESIG